jgi:hypothetical protein
MKYLMLFEAFESDVISRITKFIKSKVDDGNVRTFLDDLKSINKYIDIPIDKITNNDVEYLSAKKALKIDKKDKVSTEDPSNIYCLKFWFSLKDGYVGFSGVGDYIVELNSHGVDKKEFTERDINYIKDNLNIK